jgi:MerR family transcriptional regulator/heat shock protein HspR
MVNEGINLAGIKRIIELESAMSNMAIEIAKLRIEVDALLERDSTKEIAIRRRIELIPLEKSRGYREL